MMPLDHFPYTPSESLDYYPGGVVGDLVKVTAYVERDQSNELHGGLVHYVDITVGRGTETGRLAAVDIGTDTVKIKVDPYGSAVVCRVVRMLSGDAYAWKLRCYR
jgi:hypothetical protein